MYHLFHGLSWRRLTPNVQIMQSFNCYRERYNISCQAKRSRDIHLREKSFGNYHRPNSYILKKEAGISCETLVQVLDNNSRITHIIKEIIIYYYYYLINYVFYLSNWMHNWIILEES